MANVNSTSLRNNLVQSLTMSGNLTWAKADFKGKFTVFISATGSTRTLTISNLGFVAGDFLCLLIDQNSTQDVTIIIGSTATPRTLSANRGNIINAIFDGTNWNVWSGGGVFNTSSSETRGTAFGIRAKATSRSTAFGGNTAASGSLSSAFGSETSASGSNACAFGKDSNASGTNSTAYGSVSNTSGSSACAFGFESAGSSSDASAFGDTAKANASQSLSLGAKSNANNFARSNNIGAYVYGRRYGTTRIHLGTTTSTTDATNPSQNKEWATWNGTTANATITEIFLRGVASNRCVLQAKNVIAFKGQAVAFKSDYTGSAVFSIEGMIKRDGANNTTLVGHTKTKSHSDGTGNTVDLTISADDTNESLRVQVTGNASETWTWLVELELLDLRIA